MNGMVLGAEYLPVRDTFAWLLARVAPIAPLPFHAAQPAVYALALLFLALALHTHARSERDRPLPAAILTALACLAKGED